MAKHVKKISEDLHNTLLDNEHLEEVHFTASGDHFFHVKELKDARGKGTGRLFGNLKTEIKQTEKVLSNGGIEKKSKFIQTANKEYEIVETLSREECLELETYEIDYAEVLNPARPYLKRKKASAMNYEINSGAEETGKTKRQYNKKSTTPTE